MPAARIGLALIAPVANIALAALLMLAMERTLTFADMAAAVIGAWLVLALGAWIRYRVEGVASARIAVIGIARSRSTWRASSPRRASTTTSSPAGSAGPATRPTACVARQPPRGAPDRARPRTSSSVRAGQRSLRGRGALPCSRPWPTSASTSRSR